MIVTLTEKEIKKKGGGGKYLWGVRDIKYISLEHMKFNILFQKLFNILLQKLATYLLSQYFLPRNKVILY